MCSDFPELFTSSAAIVRWFAQSSYSNSCLRCSMVSISQDRSRELSSLQETRCRGPTRESLRGEPEVPFRLRALASTGAPPGTTDHLRPTREMHTQAEVSKDRCRPSSRKQETHRSHECRPCVVLYLRVQFCNIRLGKTRSSDLYSKPSSRPRGRS